MKIEIKEFDSGKVLDMVKQLAESDKVIPVKIIIAILSHLLEDSKIGKEGNRMLAEQLKNFKEKDMIEVISLILCNSIAASLYYTVIEPPDDYSVEA